MVEKKWFLAESTNVLKLCECLEYVQMKSFNYIFIFGKSIVVFFIQLTYIQSVCYSKYNKH